MVNHNRAQGVVGEAIGVGGGLGKVKLKVEKVIKYVDFDSPNEVEMLRESVSLN